MRRVWDSINWRLLVVIISAGAIGDSVMGLLPVMTGAAMDDLGISHSAAGLIISAELLALSITLALTTPFTGIVYRRRLAYRAFGVILAGSVLSIFVESFEVIVMARFVVGLGEGVVMALGAASVATSKAPERLMAQNMAFGVLGGALLLGVMPSVAASFGLTGVYVGHILYISCFLPFLRLMPEAPRQGAPWRTALHGVTDRTGKGKRAVLPYVAIAGMICVVLVETAAWSFVERKGVSLGLGPAEVGRWLATMFLSMVVGAIISAVLGTRFGRAIPFSVGGIMLVFGLYTALGATDLTGYVIGLLTWNISWMFLIPYYVGLVSSLDHEGRWISLSSTLLQFTNVFGPLLGGAILSGVDAGGHQGFAVLAQTTALVSAVGVLIVTPMMIILGRRMAAADGAAPVI